jgi:hypothetical protein
MDEVCSFLRLSTEFFVVEFLEERGNVKGVWVLERLLLVPVGEDRLVFECDLSWIVDPIPFL